MAKKLKWNKLPALTVPLFQSANIYLAVTREEFQHAEKFLGGDGRDMPFNSGLAANFENEDTGERVYLIGVFDKNLSTLVHECAHVCFYVCSDVGITTRPNEANETYCYLLDRMFSHFAPFIAEQSLAEE